MIVFFSAIIVILVDFSKEEKINYNVDVYKAYYIYDINSNPINISYYLINVDTNTSPNIIIDKIINKILNNISDELLIKNYYIDNNTLIMTVNQDINKYNIHQVNCLVNSLIQIKNINQIKFVNQNSNKEKTFQKTIDNYYIISPINNKLYTFLYRDSNYKIKYIDNNSQEKYLTIKQSKEHMITYQIDEEQYQLKVIKDGLYLNNQKVLNASYKTNEQWDTFTIEKVYLSEDKSLVIEVLNNQETYKEKYIFKQGIGIYKYICQDNKGNTINSLIYQEKVLNND